MGIRANSEIRIPSLDWIEFLMMARSWEEQGQTGDVCSSAMFLYNYADICCPNLIQLHARLIGLNLLVTLVTVMSLWCTSSHETCYIGDARGWHRMCGQFSAHPGVHCDTVGPILIKRFCLVVKWGQRAPPNIFLYGDFWIESLFYNLTWIWIWYNPHLKIQFWSSIYLTIWPESDLILFAWSPNEMVA